MVLPCSAERVYRQCSAYSVTIDCLLYLHLPVSAAAAGCLVSLPDAGCGGVSINCIIVRCTPAAWHSVAYNTLACSARLIVLPLSKPPVVLLYYFIHPTKGLHLVSLAYIILHGSATGDSKVNVICQISTHCAIVLT